MFIKRIFTFAAIAFGLAACTGGTGGWHTESGDVPTGRPGTLQDSFNYPEYEMYGRSDAMYTYTPTSESKTVSVLLPLSGASAAVGNGIETSVEMAFLQRKYENVSVSFHDLSGNRTQKQNIITNVLATEPDIIIGPVFAEDAQLLRDMKPSDLPVLSFTSDASAVGSGVMTMALMPMQSIEMIVREIETDGAKSMVILAPQSASGELMAGAAVQSANIYDMPISGLFYYTEGNLESIKAAAQKAAMYNARTSANTRAREILSEILLKENLTAEQKSSLNAQLDKISKSDTLGRAPYDSVLFLGNAGDSKSLASFLRYFDVGVRDVNFYGTALWDTPEISSDLTMSGAKFAVMPAANADFAKLYEEVAGRTPTRLDSFGFDAANLAIGMLHSSKTPAAYLLDPSGYKGLDGLFRLRPDGTNERALKIVELGGDAPRTVKPAATDFLVPLYNVQSRHVNRAREMELVGDGVNPGDYIKIPDSLRGKYKSKTFGANTARAQTVDTFVPDEVIIMPEDDSEIFESPDFQPVSLETVDRKLIDSVEVNQ